MNFNQSFLESEKNFALESYGQNSKCFEHTENIWEERSCRQTREWQHWGSGCYNYKCENGHLHIIVGNYSFECFHAGQELNIRIMAYGWLHKGTIILNYFILIKYLCYLTIIL
jgi:leishmanolysin-like peptidase